MPITVLCNIQRYRTVIFVIMMRMKTFFFYRVDINKVIVIIIIFRSKKADMPVERCVAVFLL